MNLNQTQLVNKSLPGIKPLLKNSFEYMLAGLSNEFIRINKLTSIFEFNVKNDITFSKSIVYPFFVAISNGHSESLYNLFGEFIPFKFGPASMPIFYEIKNLKYFGIGSNSQALGIQVLDKQINDFEVLKNKLREEQLFFQEGTCLFKNVSVLSDDKRHNPIHVAIDSAIKSIMRQSHDTFFKASSDDLFVQASYALKNARDLTKDSAIKLDRLVNAEQRPYYNKEFANS